MNSVHNSESNMERVGYRRLYRTRGCSLEGLDALDLAFVVGDVNVEVHLGPRPKLGVTVAQEFDKYVAPGEDALLSRLTFHKDATKAPEAGGFFTEIRCTQLVDVPAELRTRFRAHDPAAQEALLEMATALRQPLSETADLIAGFIGLRFHRQLVLELRDENAFVERSADDHPTRVVSRSLELLDGVRLNKIGIGMLEAALPALGAASIEDRRRASIVLRWFLKAWEDRDPITKFIALFTALELALEGIGSDPAKDRVREEHCEALLLLVRSHGGDRRDQLVALVERLAQRPPSLNERFEQLATMAQLSGWKHDIEAFKAFNASRNGLLHRGSGVVRLSYRKGTAAGDICVMLEDLAERYVSYVLFGDAQVYPSQWRPKAPVDIVGQG